jgi:hypothetical protein
MRVLVRLRCSTGPAVQPRASTEPRAVRHKGTSRPRRCSLGRAQGWPIRAGDLECAHGILVLVNGVVDMQIIGVGILYPAMACCEQELVGSEAAGKQMGRDAGRTLLLLVESSQTRC